MNEDKRLSITVPLIGLSDEDEQQYLDGCVQQGADSVFLMAPCDNIVRSKRAVKYQHLSPKILEPVPNQRICDLPSIELAEQWAQQYRSLAPRYLEKGIEPYIWICHTIGHGGALSTKEEAPFQTIVGTKGQVADGCFCPLDQEFVDYQCQFLAKIAASGAPLILLDDDFRLNAHGPVDLSCFCPLHLEYYNNRFGTQFTREELVERIMANDPVARANFETMNSDIMLEFAGALEKAVHAVNPTTRLGLASCRLHFSVEAPEIRALVRRLAGNTRPYIRVFGAPYHVKNNPRVLGHTIEMARAFHDYVNDGEIEVSSEGDTYPHSRFFADKTITKAYLLASRCAGLRNMLYYSYPVSASPREEPVYIEAIQELSTIRKELDLCLTADAIAEGLAPVISIQNTRAIPLRKDMSSKELCWPDEPVALDPMTRFGIPLSNTANAETGSAPVLFAGWHGYNLPDQKIGKLLDRGAIIDAQAAQWLMARGHDIGLEEMIALPQPPTFELYDGPLSKQYRNEQIWQLCAGDPVFFSLKLKNDAQACSHFVDGETGEVSIGSARYEKNGRRIFVLGFDFFGTKAGMQTVFNLARQEQLRNAAQWLGVGCHVYNQDNLYLLAYKKEREKTLFLIKTGLDSLPTVQLYLKEKPVSDLRFLDQDGPVAGSVPYTVSPTEDGWILEITRKLHCGDFLMVQFKA